jgi:hypothetical protein
MLVDSTARLGGELLAPTKTNVVQNLRCMTTGRAKAGGLR